MKYKKSLIIPRIDRADRPDIIAHNLLDNGVHILIDTLNWPERYPSRPLSTATLGHDGKQLCVLFTANCSETRAMTTVDLGPVADDTCFELFIKHPGNPRYWNFEFNTLGIANVSSRTERKNATRFTSTQLELIKRYGSTITAHPATVADPDKCQWLLVTIDLSLIGLNDIDRSTLLEGNIYSCAAAINTPYYLSWNPIDTTEPDFHRPEFFGYLILE